MERERERDQSIDLTWAILHDNNQLN